MRDADEAAEIAENEKQDAILSKERDDDEMMFVTYEEGTNGE